MEARFAMSVRFHAEAGTDTGTLGRPSAFISGDGELRRGTAGMRWLDKEAAAYYGPFDWQRDRGRCNLRTHRRQQARGLRNCYGVAAIVIATRGNIVQLSPVRAVVVHRPAHAAGMRGGSRDRQSHGGKRAHEHENQNQPGSQTIHKNWVRHRTITQTMGNSIR